MFNSDIISSGIHGNPVRASMRYQNYSNMSGSIISSSLDDDIIRRHPLYVVLPMTVIYVVIFFTGVIGNISTCVVIARNKSMHTATNYYLFSLSVSDLLLLVSGLPQEIYYTWSHFPYIFGEMYCIMAGFASETAANATVLTITAFTVERYVAICHPFISHTMSKLSRAVKFVVAIWLLALCLAVPQAIQFGIKYDYFHNGTANLDTAMCTMKWELLKHSFEISTILFFVLPMTIITVLYILIAVKLRRSRLLTATTVKRNPITDALNHVDNNKRKSAAQRNVIRMLIAVVVAFFICWAPFHAQRVMAAYFQKNEPNNVSIKGIYDTLTYISGVFYYLSTTINPLLYNILSNKFREAFKSMLPKRCGKRYPSNRSSFRRPSYSSLSRYQRSLRHRMANDDQQSPSISISDEQQRLTRIGLTNVNFCELNGLASRNNEQQVRPVVDIVRETGCREYVRSVSRGSSNSSQLTMMTSVSKSLNEGNNNIAANESIVRIHRSPKAFTLAGILRERLGFRTKRFFAYHRKSPARPKSNSEIVPIATQLRFHSHPSLGSDNTISNSSLQDLDETEFTGSELAEYMGELNFNLIT